MCLLFYLIGHNNPINGFRPAARHPSRCLHQLVTSIDERASSICSFQRIQNRSLRRIPLIVTLNTHLAGASFPYERHGRASTAAERLYRWRPQTAHNWIECGNYRTGPKIISRIISCTMSISLKTSDSSQLNRMRKSSYWTQDHK